MATASFILIGFTVALLILYFVQPTGLSLTRPFNVYGVRVKASLDEIFNKIVASKRINLKAVLDKNKNTIWSDSIQLHLSSEYYDIGEYVLLIEPPAEVTLDGQTLFEEQIDKRLEHILKRYDIVICLTDAYGNCISTEGKIAWKLALTLITVFGILAAVLFAYFKVIGKR
jgi:hypothetical protein